MSQNRLDHNSEHLSGVGEPESHAKWRFSISETLRRAHTHTHTHTRMQTDKHKHTHTRMQTDKHKHTHTHTLLWQIVGLNITFMRKKPELTSCALCDFFAAFSASFCCFFSAFFDMGSPSSLKSASQTDHSQMGTTTLCNEQEGGLGWGTDGCCAGRS